MRVKDGTFEAYGSFIGFDFADGLSCFNRISFFLQPFDEVSFLHCRRQGGEAQLLVFGVSPYRPNTVFLSLIELVWPEAAGGGGGGGGAYAA